MVEWSQNPYGDGIIVGTNETQEWMLKWWWDHYSKHNSYPVTFFDMGMSKSARHWCATKGNVISYKLPKEWIKSKEAISKEDVARWEATYPGDVWAGRMEWFTKPFLLLKTPYERTIWLDLDCEVRRPIDSLFDFAEGENGFSMLHVNFYDFEVYNTGVMVFKHGSPIPLKWAEYTKTENHKHFGDETLLMDMLNQEKINFTPHSLIYNWPTIIPQDSQTYIRHHIGGYGKSIILRGLQ